MSGAACAVETMVETSGLAIHSMDSIPQMDGAEGAEGKLSRNAKKKEKKKERKKEKKAANVNGTVSDKKTGKLPLPVRNLLFPERLLQCLSRCFSGVWNLFTAGR